MTDTFTVEPNGYIDFPVTTNPDTLQQNALTEIAADLPGWVPRDSHIEVLILQQFAAMVAESAQVAAQVPPGIFAYYGTTLLGLPPNPGTAATAETTWIMVDAGGYTVPAGTLVGYTNFGTNAVFQFQTVADFSVDAGDTTATNVEIQAVAVGVAYNNLANSSQLAMLSALSFVASITSTTESAGGTDAETATEYLDRLSRELRLMSMSPVIASDYANLAQEQTVVPGVYRATAFGGLNPYTNLLPIEDSTFVGGLGNWIAVTNCSVATGTSSSGYPALQITVTAGGSASKATTSGSPNPYFLNENRDYTLFGMWDSGATTTGLVSLTIQCYDAANNLTGTFTSSPIGDNPVLTNNERLSVLKFTTPAYTAYGIISANVSSASTTAEVHYLTFVDLARGGGNIVLTNYIPDSALATISTTGSWVNTGTSLSLVPYVTFENAWQYEGTGSGATWALYSQTVYAASGAYTLSAQIDASNATAGSVDLDIYDASGGLIGTVSQPAGNSGLATGTITLGSAAAIHLKIVANGLTVTNGTFLTIAEPCLETNPAGPYTIGPTWSAPNTAQNNERTVTVVAVDDLGDALSDSTYSALEAFLESKREVNFIVYGIRPAYTSISVTWTAVAEPGYDTMALSALVNDRLEQYLSPANWASPAQNVISEPTTSPPVWNPNDNTVHYLSVASVINDTPGIDHITTLAMWPTISTGSWGGSTTSDIVMHGVAALPVPGVISGGAS